MVELRVLGSPSLVGPDGHEVNSILQQPKRLGLLTYLALTSYGSLQRRDRILGVFWPDSPEDKARASLATALVRLRDALGGDVILKRGRGDIGINPAALSCDAVQFLEAVEAEDWSRAVEAYRGPLLDGFFLDGCPEFDSWLEHTRAHLKRRAVSALGTLTEKAMAAGDETARALAERAYEIDPLDGAAVRRLMQVLALAGQRDAALGVHESYAATVHEERGIEPSPETVILVQDIREGRLGRESSSNERVEAPDAVVDPTQSRPSSEPVAHLNAALAGRYRIVREIGVGGMATVYVASDERHNRNVALKVLKPELAAVVGGDRFLAEIETTANLQHPHILPLFDSGEADGFLFYVMPYVEGESLRERLDREHQLPVDDAVRIATNVVEALDYAHRQGVIHRDIKPANILLQDGKPVVSDFGIALALSSAGGHRLTETGLSLGTPHYMSPEQATGDQNVGPSTDVWALGCVLYEMLVGEPPYTGSTPQAILGRIITGEAPMASRQRSSVPHGVDAAIRKALEKLPADRFTGGQDFVKAIGDPGFRHVTDATALPAAAVAGLWKPLAIATTGLAALFAGFAGWALLRPEASPTPQPVTRQVVSTRPAASVAPTLGMSDVAISPDGRNIVYQSYDALFQLLVRSVDQLESVRLRGPDAAIGPFVSPDGEWVAFQAGPGGPLQRVPIVGGPPLTICSLTAGLSGASWGPDGTIVFALDNTSGLWQVSATGGEPTSLLIPDAGRYLLPDVLPSGDGVLFVDSSAPGVIDDQIAVLDLRTGEHHRIIEAGTSPRYAASGHIVYALGNTLMAVGFDPERLEVTSEPVPLVQGVDVKASGVASFSLSKTGSLVYATGAASSGLRSAVWVDRDGREEPLPLPPQTYRTPRLSRDGTRLAVTVTDGEGNSELWVYDVASADGWPLTQQGAANTPVWTSSDRIAFTSDAAGSGLQIHSVLADGGAGPELLLPSEGGDFPTSVTPDGQTLVFTRVLTNDHREILQLPLQGDPPVPKPVLSGEFSRGNAEVSPDGRWVVYRSDQSGQVEVYVQPYPLQGPAVKASIGGGSKVTWSPDGNELIYRRDDRMMAVSFDVDGGTPRIGPPRELFRGTYYASDPAGSRQYHLAPDGRFLMLKDIPTMSGDDLRQEVVLVQNWFEELRERVPN